MAAIFLVSLYLSDTEIGGDSTIFHAINRGKESLALDLKNEVDRAFLRRLIATADVLIQNFRPGVIDRLGLGYDAVKQLNPKLVYASISGYGENGEWATRPGQDLLAQARSGLMWLNGHDDQGPVPFGLAVADIMAGANLCQGILAALVRRGVTAQGAHVQTSLLESLVDLQFEVLTTHLNDGRRPPKRGEFRNAHAYLAAPYGVYPARDGFLAVAMTPLNRLQDLLDVEGLAPFRNDPKAGFDRRDEIKQMIAERIATGTVDHWLSILEPAGVWCSASADLGGTSFGRQLPEARHDPDADARKRARVGDDELSHSHGWRPTEGKQRGAALRRALGAASRGVQLTGAPRRIGCTVLVPFDGSDPVIVGQARLRAL